MARTRRGVGPDAVIETPCARAAAARAAIAAAFPVAPAAPAAAAGPAAADACAWELHAAAAAEVAEDDEEISGLLRFVSGDTVLGSGGMCSGDFRRVPACWRLGAVGRGCAAGGSNRRPKRLPNDRHMRYMGVTEMWCRVVPPATQHQPANTVVWAHVLTRRRVHKPVA